MKTRRQTLASLSSNARPTRDTPSGKKKRYSMLPTTSRRKSSMGARRQSLAAGGSRRSSVYAGRSSQRQKDPRPIGDKKYRDEMINQLAEFLVDRNYGSAMTHKMLMAPSGSDFRRICEFIVGQLDPNFVFDDGKFETQMHGFLYALGYPARIAVSSFKAPGSPVSWPNLLAALVWLIEEVQLAEACAGAAVDIGEDGKAGGDDIEPVQKAFQRIVVEAYNTWMEEDDDEAGDDADGQGKVDGKLQELFEIRDEAVRGRCGEIAAELERLETETSTLKLAATRVADLRAQKTDLLCDREKFAGLNAKMAGYVAQLAAKEDERAKQLAAFAESTERVREENAELRELIAAQPFKPDEVERMNLEKAAVEEELADAMQRKREASDRHFELTKCVARASQQLQEHVNAFNDRVCRLRLPQSELELRFVAGAANAREMLGGRDLQRDIKPAMMRIVDEMYRRLDAAGEQEREAADRASVHAQMYEERKAGVDEAKQRLQKAEEEFVAERASVGEQLSELIEQVRRVEAEIHTVQAERGVELGASVKKLKQTSAQAEHFAQAAAEEYEALNEEICTIMDEITQHKERTQSRLAAVLAGAQQARRSLA